MPEPDEDLKEEVRALLAEERKIEAIKLVREETGYSLLEAKNFVEALQRGQDWTGGPAPSSLGDFEQELVNLLRQGKKIEAVKYFRAETGAGLKDAYESVRELAQRHGIEFKSGCLGVVLLAALGLGLCWWI